MKFEECAGGAEQGGKLRIKVHIQKFTLLENSARITHFVTIMTCLIQILELDQLPYGGDRSGGLELAPLLKASDCCVLLIDPLRRNLDRDSIDLDRKATLTGRLARISDAIKICNVPTHFAVGDRETSLLEWLVQPPHKSTNFAHCLKSTGAAWQNGDLSAALARQGRSSVLIAGFWLEEHVSFAAMNALADGFDVFILMDACQSRDRHAHAPAAERLAQAGVVSFSTTQMVNEWADSELHDELRSQLQALLS